MIDPDLLGGIRYGPLVNQSPSTKKEKEEEKTENAKTNAKFKQPSNESYAKHLELGENIVHLP